MTDDDDPEEYEFNCRKSDDRKWIDIIGVSLGAMLGYAIVLTISWCVGSAMGWL